MLSLFVIVNLIQAVFTPISFDESYYWVWSKHLDWGYFDHPPMIAWWVWLGGKFFNGTLGVRLITALMNVSGIFIFWKILTPENLKQFRLFAILTGSVIVIQVFGFISTPDAPLLFFGLLYLLSLKRFLEKDSTLNTILLAISMCGMMYSKYHGLLMILFTVLPIFLKLIKKPRFYLAVILSLILYIPHLNWIFNHDFVNLRYQLSGRSQDEEFTFWNVLIYPLIYFFGMAPLLSWFSVKSLFKFKALTDFQKSIYSLAILPGIFFFIMLFRQYVQAQWLMISFIGMMMIFYWYYAERESDKWLIRLGFTGVALFFVVRIVLMLPMVSPFSINPYFASELRKMNIENAVFEKYQEASIYLFYNPDRKATVHRTLGNRESQYTLWDWEDEMYGKTIDYISPWVYSDDSIRAYKNFDYRIVRINNYQTFYKLKINTEDKLSTFSGGKISLNLNFQNGHNHPLTIGGKSDLRLTVNYYRKRQHEISYTTEIRIPEVTLAPGETKELHVNYRNIPEKGKFFASFGIFYADVGTTYLSEPVEVVSR